MTPDKVTESMRFLAVLSALVFLLGCSDTKAPSTSPQPVMTAPSDPVLLPSAAGDTAPVSLEARWIEGKRYVQRVASNQKSLLTASTRSEPVPQTVSTSQEYAVDVVSAAQRTQLDVEFLSFALTMTQGGRKVFGFDSSGSNGDADDNPVVKSVAKLIGQHLTFFTASDHTVQEIRGVDLLEQRLTASAPPQARFILSGIINTNTLKQMVEIYHGLPPRPVRPGDSWPLELEFSLGPVGIALLQATNTFTGWAEKDNKRCALIKYSGLLRRKTDSPAAPLGGDPQIQNGTLRGQSWFDPETGALLESVTEQSMSMIIQFNPQSHAQRAQIVTNIVHTTITQTLIEVRDIP